MNRKRVLTFAVGALLAAAIAGGVAYATIPGPGNVYSACMLKSIGTIRLIDKSLPATNLMSRCTDKEIEISWNQAGQPGPPGPQGAKGEPGMPGTNGTNGTNGKDGTDGTDGVDGDDGVSVTSAVEPVGTNCANGGSKFTAANGVTYACNGAPGPSGQGGGPIRSVQLPVGGPIHSQVGGPTTIVLFDLAGIGRFTAKCGTNSGLGVGPNGEAFTAPGWEYSNTSGEERTLFAQLTFGDVQSRALSVAPGGVLNSGVGSAGFLDQIQVFPSSAGTATSPAIEVSIAGIADENNFGAPCTFWATATTL